MNRRTQITSVVLLLLASMACYCAYGVNHTARRVGGDPELPVGTASFQQPEVAATTPLEEIQPGYLIDPSHVPHYAQPLPGYGEGTRVENGRVILGPPNNIFEVFGDADPADWLNITLLMIQDRDPRLGFSACSTEMVSGQYIPLSSVVSMAFQDDGDGSDVIIAASELSTQLAQWGLYYPTSNEYDVSIPEARLMTLIVLKFANGDIGLCYFGEHDAIAIGDIQGLFTALPDYEQAIMREAEQLKDVFRHFFEKLELKGLEQHA